jgi:hypothetical protein
VPRLRNLDLDLQSWLEDFSANAEYHFKTAVNEDFQLANFLIELIEMCEGNVKKLKDLFEMISKMLKTFWKVYKATGKFWLAWNFAIKPNIGDVKSILKSVEKAARRLRWLRDHNHLDTTVKYREGNREFRGAPFYLGSGTEWDSIVFPLPEVTPPDPPPLVEPYPDPGWFQLEDWLAVVKISSWATVRFEIEDEYLNSPLALFGVWEILAGLYNPVEIVWEAIPYSWLIDWFLSQKTKLKRKLASLSPLKDAKIIQVGHTISVTLTGKVELYGQSDQESIHIGEIRYECYDRQPGYPTEGGSLFDIPDHWYNASILLALIAQKHRRRAT